MIVTPDNIDTLTFGADGLMPAIAQDAYTGEVLMLAWVNAQAVTESLRRSRAVFFSRSRKTLWEKGETSGNVLQLKAIHTDCDRDTLLLLVRPAGPACHTGTLTCFADTPLTSAARVGFLNELEEVIDQRLRDGGPKSYTARLVAEGPKRLAQKVGEEGLETALALSADNDGEARSEAADLLFHLAVALRARGQSLGDVVAELKRRHTEA